MPSSAITLIKHVVKGCREIFGMPKPDALLTDEIKGAPYYDGYQEHVSKYQQHLDAEHGKVEEGGATESLKATKGTKPKAAKATKPAGDKIKGWTSGKNSKPRSPLKLVDEPSAEDVPVEEPAYNEEEANVQRALKLSLKEQAERTQGLARLVVIREPDSRRIQPLPYRRTPMLTEASRHVESPSLDAELAMTDGETESDNVASKIDTGDQDEAGSNLGDAAKSQPQSSHVVHVGPNRKHMDLEATDASTQQNPEQMDEEFTTTVYPNVQENLKLPYEDLVILKEPQHEEEPGKTNAEVEFGSPLPTSTATTSAVMTTTTLPPPPPQPQQSFADPTLLQRIVDEIVTDAVDWAIPTPIKSGRSSPEEKKETCVPRTPSGSLPPQPPPPPSPVGASGAPSTSGASRSSPLPPPSLPPSTSTFEFAQQQGSEALSLSKSIASASQSMAWTTSDTRYESASVSGLKNVENNWATALVSAYETPAENSLLTKTGDMTNFLNWYCRQVNKTALTPANLESQAYELVKAFYPDVIHIQFQMEECHKMLTYQVDRTNPEGDQVRVDVNRPLPLGGPPDLEYLRYGSKGSSPALSISKMKAASYRDFGLELPMSEQIVIRIKAYSRYGYDYLSEIVLRRADLQEHTIAKKDFKNLYPSDFEDLILLLLQGHLDHLLGFDKRMLSTVVKLSTRNLVIRQRVEDFQLGIESYQTQLNLTKPG
nr:hypothetical protein [Tanacetum cinerariifolium]